MIKLPKKTPLIALGLVAIAVVISVTILTRDKPSTSDSYPVPAGWKTYSSEKLGVQFQYPPTLKACEIPGLGDFDLNQLVVVLSWKNECTPSTQEPGRWESVAGYYNIGFALYNSTVPVADVKNPNDLAKDFTGYHPEAGSVANPQLRHFRLDGLPAYGGPIIGTQDQEPSGYSVLVEHHGNLFHFNNSAYRSVETETILHSFRFDSEKYPR